MPIILNHSNIGVQYSTGSNYIIETVKSDLYRRNEIVETIVRDNLQTAPVIPIVSIQEGSNIYAVESYTYSGSANTADFTRVFPKSTTCDILIIGGGGAGGTGHGGGGGGGSVIYTTGLSFEGEYNIKVGKGGIPAATRVNNGGNGNDSFVVKNGTNLYLAKGGGGGGFAAPYSVGSDGGSGGGGQGNSTNGVGGLAVSTNIPTGVYGFAGGRGNTNVNLFAGGGGGGGETIGSDAVVVNTSSQINGGNGGNGKQIPITGNSLRYGGGGGGSVSHQGVNNIVGNGGLGGGGNGGLRVNGFTGTDGLGGGGGGGGQDANGDKIGGTGGSGIVIIRYLLATIPANNYLTNEPTVNPYVIATDVYYPKVPATNSFTWTDSGYTVNVKVSDIALGSYSVYYLFNHIITTNPATGGDDYYHSQQIYTGAGNTYNGVTRFKTFAGIAIGVDYGRSIYPTRMRIAPHPSSSVNLAFPKAFKIFASDDAFCWNDNNHSSWTQIHDQTTTLTITNGQYTIVNFTANLPKYRYYTMVVLSVIGSYSSGGFLVFAEWNIGGDEKIDAIPEGNPITHKTLNFAYVPPPLTYDFTNYNTSATWLAYAATIPTFTYSLNYILDPFDPDAVFIATSAIGWVQMTLPSTHNFFTITYGLGTQAVEPVRLLVNGVVRSTHSTVNSVKTYSQGYNVGDVVRIEEGLSTMSANFIFQFTNTNSTTNTYALNFPVPTLADINNNTNIVLRGDYDIALSTSNAIIIPKTGQYIPKPTTFTNYAVERMYPPVRNFTAATTTVSGQTYGNGTYVVSFSSTYGGGYDPFKCFNTSDGVGGVWEENTRYNAGVFNSTSFIVTGYLGDWLKIQLPVAIKLTRFEILSRVNATLRAPKDFKIYGSNDNITWFELVNKTNAVYNSSNKYEQATPEITNTYTYYGLVVNKLFGTAAVLNFDEWYIYGQEVLPSSLALRYHLLNPTLDPIGAQWTYSSNNTNVYHMGRVGIGTTNPEYQLDVRGAIYSSTGGYTSSTLTKWSVMSDRRIKENIVKASYDKCLENVKNIELYNFNFKDNCVNTNDRHQLGFIAQEVQQVYPKAVEVGKMIVNLEQKIDDLLTLNITQIDYTLYGAVKSLIEKIENIKIKMEHIKTTYDIP